MSQEREYYDKSIIIDFPLPDYLEEAITNLIAERKKDDSLEVDFYEEDLIGGCNEAFNDGLLTREQVSLLRKKYLG